MDRQDSGNFFSINHKLIIIKKNIRLQSEVQPTLEMRLNKNVHI